MHCSRLRFGKEMGKRSQHTQAHTHTHKEPSSSSSPSPFCRSASAPAAIWLLFPVLQFNLLTYSVSRSLIRSHFRFLHPASHVSWSRHIRTSPLCTSLSSLLTIILFPPFSKHTHTLLLSLSLPTEPLNVPSLSSRFMMRDVGSTHIAFHHPISRFNRSPLSLLITSRELPGLPRKLPSHTRLRCRTSGLTSQPDTFSLLS